MRRLLVISVVFVTLIVVIDIVFGWFADRQVNKRALGGDYVQVHHVINEFDDSVLVLGSSVALNSINTKTLSDSLGLSAYNCGANGQEFPFHTTMLKAAVGSGRAPGRVILCVTPLGMTTTGRGSRYSLLTPYYGHGIADIDSVMQTGEVAGGYLLNSSLYRYNRMWFRILLYSVMSPGVVGENGFIAKPVPPEFPARFGEDDVTVRMSDERRRELIEFVDICRDNGIALWVIVTPQYLASGTNYSGVIDEIMAVCDSCGVGFYNDLRLEPFNSDSTLFYDKEHININGSAIYTDTIVHRLLR